MFSSDAYVKHLEMIPKIKMFAIYFMICDYGGNRYTNARNKEDSHKVLNYSQQIFNKALFICIADPIYVLTNLTLIY